MTIVEDATNAKGAIDTKPNSRASRRRTSRALAKRGLRAGGYHSQKSETDKKDPAKTFIPGPHMFAGERAVAGEPRDRDEEFYFLSFRLRDEFVERYRDRQPKWGFPIGAGNTLGEYNWLTKYSRKKLDGTKERFWEGCRRVIEGMYSIQKDHAMRYVLPWSEETAHTSAEEAYDRLFNGKWSPPGRGLWMMGTFFVNGLRDSSALQNCGFLSTSFVGEGDPTFPFHRMMEMSMLGVGVGFDTFGAGKVTLNQPIENDDDLIAVDDSREGWYESTAMLLRSYFIEDQRAVRFDYSEIRQAGEAINGFGGTAAGPEPLIQLQDRLRGLLNYRQGEQLTSSDIVDIMNMIGKCVVAANVRSSAQIALGSPTDDSFLTLKDPFLHPERMGYVRALDGNGPLIEVEIDPETEEPVEKWIESEQGGWGYTSNNSAIVEVGMNLDHLARGIKLNGEPGTYWLDMCRQHGRLADPPDGRDHRVMGVNPCGEQPLENNELCTLVETYPTNCRNREDYMRTLKFAYLYGKTVTLLPTHWPETNEIMIRNRRIGTSMTGLAMFVEEHGWHELKQWQDHGYQVIRKWDVIYSEWLGVRESIKVTTVKPSGTVSLLFGVTPGCHWPKERGQYLRTVRETVGNPVAKAMEEAGYHVEPNVQNPEFGLVITCPTRGPDIRGEREVSVWEKVALAAQCQEWWSDNSVSVTATFNPETEAEQIPAVIRANDGKVKSLSFLAAMEGIYAQAPYQRVEPEVFQEAWDAVSPVDWDRLYAGDAWDAAGERYCNNDVCEVPQLVGADSVS